MTTTKAPTQAPTTAPTTAAQTTKAATTTASSSTFKCTTDGYFAYPGDCTKYIWCVSGTQYTFSCGAGLGWNAAITACDYKYNIPGCV